MARLIPSSMDDYTPPGERDVFNLVAAGPDDWVALHSIDLAPWNRGLRTEIDFVIIELYLKRVPTVHTLFEFNNGSSITTLVMPRFL